MLIRIVCASCVFDSKEGPAPPPSVCTYTSGLILRKVPPPSVCTYTRGFDSIEGPGPPPPRCVHIPVVFSWFIQGLIVSKPVWLRLATGGYEIARADDL